MDKPPLRTQKWLDFRPESEIFHLEQARRTLGLLQSTYKAREKSTFGARTEDVVLGAATTLQVKLEMAGIETKKAGGHRGGDGPSREKEGQLEAGMNQKP